jgi:hypothetical protein
MSITINPVFKIGEIVYLKTDDAQNKRMITGYTIRLKTIVYLVSCFHEEYHCYDYELTNEYDVLKAIDNDKESN